MPSLAIAGWVLLRLIRQPSSWLWLGCAGVLWLGALALSPIGMTTISGEIAPVFYELAFLSLLAGCSLALLPLSEAEWFLARLPALARLRGRAAGLLGGGTLGLGATLLLPALTARMSLLEVGVLVGGSAATLLHVALLGLLLASAPLPATARALGLPLLAWVLPASLPTSSLLGRGSNVLLDASAHFGAASHAAAAPSLARWVALLALLGAAILVETRSRGRTPAGTEHVEAR